MRNIHTIRTNREPIKGDILLRHIWKNQPNECISWWRYNETIDIENVKQYTTLNGSFRDMYQSFEVRNLYITTKGSFARDEYITDGTEVIKATSKLVNAQGFADGRDWKKIVLTTDPDLIAEHVKSAGDEFLEWFVKNPSCEKVKVETFEVEDYVGFAGHTGYPTFHNEYKIIIPKEEPKTAWVGVLHDKLNGYHPAEYELKEIYQGEGCLPNFPNEELCQIWCDSNYKEVPKEEQKQHLIDMMRNDEELGLYEEPKKETLEDFCIKFIERHFEDEKTYNKSSVITAMKASAKWQQERSYSKEEVYNLMDKRETFWVRYKNTYSQNYISLKELFEQFKKK